MFASVTRCMIVSTTRRGSESSSTGISNIRSAAFDFQQTNYTLQSNRTINTQDRGSFMLVAKILCLKEQQGLYVHFYVQPPQFNLKEVAQDDICHHKNICNLCFSLKGWLLIAKLQNQGRQGHFYVDPPQFDLKREVQGQI